VIGLRLLRASDRRAEPWKNGGGITRPIAVGGLTDGGRFQWRVSMAEVAATGPFSIFEGIDRILCMMSGRLSLCVGGNAPIILDTQSEPFRFAGDVSATGGPIGDAAVDLNVMTARGGCRADVSRHCGRGDLNVSATTLLVFTGTAQAAGLDLDPHDALLIEHGDSSVRFNTAQPFCRIILKPLCEPA
jgi:hypothetical protein